LNAFEINGNWGSFEKLSSDSKKVLRFKYDFAIEMEKSCDMATHTDEWLKADNWKTVH